jgi:hypothetical protein
MPLGARVAMRLVYCRRQVTKLIWYESKCRQVSELLMATENLKFRFVNLVPGTILSRETRTDLIFTYHVLGKRPVEVTYTTDNECDLRP